MGHPWVVPSNPSRVLRAIGELAEGLAPRPPTNVLHTPVDDVEVHKADGVKERNEDGEGRLIGNDGVREAGAKNTKH